jgi:hypothetical protein
MVVMGMRDEGVINITLGPLAHPIEAWQRIGPLATRIGAGIQDNAGSSDV